jgi:CubicO group peptidase (beta-lactamase class C family)
MGAQRPRPLAAGHTYKYQVMKKLLLAGLLFPSLLSLAQTQNDAERYLRHYHELRQLSGVIRMSNPLHAARQYVQGWSNVRSGTPLSGKERFNIGSATKLFTALLVMQQVEKGKLRLDDTLSQWLPGTALPNAGKITIRHLLQHTSGLGNYMNHPAYGKRFTSGGIRTLVDLLPLIEAMPTTPEAPGTAHRYSNSGYILLGMILEKATGQPFPQLLQRAVLRPLGLEESHTLLAASDVRLARPYRFMDRQHFIEFSNPDTLRCFPDGGLLMSAGDLHRFATALLQNRLVKSTTLELMIRDTVVADRRSSYGLGITSEWIDGKQWVGHDGFSRGYSADLRILPAEKTILVALFNNNGVSSVAVNNALVAISLGQPPLLPKPYLWKVAHELYQQRPDATLAEVNVLLKEKGYQPLGSPMQLVGQTNDLSEAGLDSIALELLQFNLHLFPNETLSYKALGEAYASTGRKEAAVDCFKKALRINPADEYATRRLKELDGR